MRSRRGGRWVVAAILAVATVTVAVTATNKSASTPPAPRMLRIRAPVAAVDPCPFGGQYISTNQSTFTMHLNSTLPCATLAYSGPTNLTFFWLTTVGTVNLVVLDSACTTTGVCLNIILGGPFCNETGTSGSYTFQDASGWIYDFEAYANSTGDAGPAPGQVVWVR
jgi:hypothetical protein